MDASTLTVSVDKHAGRPARDAETRIDDHVGILLVALALA